MLFLLLMVAEPLVCDKVAIDRGQVRIGPPLVQQFQLTNQSQQSLKLAKVQSSCGCLAPKLDRTVLAGGETAILTVEVNTLSQPAGQVAWLTTIEWQSAGQTGHTTLTLKADLISEVKVEPAAIAFQVRRSRSVDVTVTDTRARPFRITDVGTSTPQIQAELIPTNDNHSHRIRLTAHADGPANNQSAVAWFATDDPMYPQIRLPITLNVLAKTRVAASPSTVFLNGAPSRILLHDSEGQAIQVDRIDVEGPITALARDSIVTVSADKAKWDGTPASGKILIHLKSPISETISVLVDIR